MTSCTVLVMTGLGLVGQTLSRRLGYNEVSFKSQPEVLLTRGDTPADVKNNGNLWSS